MDAFREQALKGTRGVSPESRFPRRPQRQRPRAAEAAELEEVAELEARLRVEVVVEVRVAAQGLRRRPELKPAIAVVRGEVREQAGEAQRQQPRQRQ